MTAVTLACIASGATRCAWAADNKADAARDRMPRSRDTETYERLTTIQIPGEPFAEFDISFIDHTLPLYYVTDRSNGALDVIDTRTNTVAAQIGGFVGTRNDPTTGKPSITVSGPDGIQAVDVGELWVGDGDSTVKVVDLFSKKVVATISTVLDGHTAAQDRRAGEMSYDPQDHILVVANNNATPPYITMISTMPSDRHVLGHVIFSNSSGAEQSIYNFANGMFYINLPHIGSNVNSGAVSIVDPRRLKEVRRFPMANCNGAGLALAPGQKLLVGCALTDNSQIISARDGTLLATIPQVSGSDEVWYNPGDKRFYLGAGANPVAAGGPALGVIDAVTNKFVINVPVDLSVHSVAADPSTNHIYVPLGPIAGDAGCASGCIGVYARKATRIRSTAQ